MLTRGGALAGLTLALALGGCSMAQARCFTQRRVVLPDPSAVMPRLSNGQAGRELAEAVWRGDAQAALTRLRADPRLASTRVVADPALTSQPDGRYGDLLTFAVASCDRSTLAALLKAGLDPNGADRGRPLELALLADDPLLAEILLVAGASPDPQKGGGVDVFERITGFNHLGAAAMLLRHGLDVRWADEFGRTHLDTALAMQAYRIGEMLLKAGADLRAADRDGFTPAHALVRAPAVSLDAEEATSRTRLIEAAKADGRPWPPVPPRGR